MFAEVPRRPAPGLQPLLHDLLTALAAPVTVLSRADGQIDPTGAQGVFGADLRLLSRAELAVADSALEAVAVEQFSASEVEFVAVLRELGDSLPDPTVWLRRRRTVRPDGLAERITVSNVTDREVPVEIGLALASDLVDIEVVKAGRTADTAAGVEIADGALTVGNEQVRVTVRTPGAALDQQDGTAVARWRTTVPPRGERVLDWSLGVVDTGAAVIAAAPSTWSVPRVTGDDRRIGPLLQRSAADLVALRMATPAQPDDTFFAAGSPWYLTLFGRDSIWAARMALPLSLEPAIGTLRTLAARQGTVTDPATAEEPGKILHEVRRPVPGSADPFLPPTYFGTVDATALWICLLGETWRWGMPLDAVRELVPNLEAALEWLARDGDADGDGFLEYVDASGRGLANQGWKDSGDSVRFADGRIAQGPVALAEVQGYAYQAAVTGADLLDAVGRPGALRWRAWADGLADRFRSSFWTADDLGAYPVLALDGEKKQVDAPASNMGHLLATGILSPAESAAVAARLVHPSMSSGFGLRTMADTTGGYSPLSYHCGSIWPHDTAIAIHGLLAADRGAEALVLVDGLLAAGVAFDGRLPELFGGFTRTEMPVPVPYPASCRPQAWSAAAAVVTVRALLGLDVDVPAGRLRLHPTPGLGALKVSGLTVAGAPLEVDVAADGTVLDVGYTGPLTVEVVQGPPADAR
jgi:glycogen debranching enzyme